MLKIKKTTKKIFIKITISNLLIQRTFQNQCKARRTKKKKTVDFFKIITYLCSGKKIDGVFHDIFFCR